MALQNRNMDRQQAEETGLNRKGPIHVQYYNQQTF